MPFHFPVCRNLLCYSTKNLVERSQTPTSSSSSTKQQNNNVPSIPAAVAPWLWKQLLHLLHKKLAKSLQPTTQHGKKNLVCTQKNKISCIYWMSCVAAAATSCACCKTWEGMDGWVLSTSISQIQVSNLCELWTKQHRNYLYPCLFCNAHLLKDLTTPQIRGTILHSIMELASQLSLLKIEEQTHSDRTSIIRFIYSCCSHTQNLSMSK